MRSPREPSGGRAPNHSSSAVRIDCLGSSRWISESLVALLSGIANVPFYPQRLINVWLIRPGRASLYPHPTIGYQNTPRHYGRWHRSPTESVLSKSGSADFDALASTRAQPSKSEADFDGTSGPSVLRFAPSVPRFAPSVPPKTSSGYRFRLSVPPKTLSVPRFGLSEGTESLSVPWFGLFGGTKTLKKSYQGVPWWGRIRESGLGAAESRGLGAASARLRAPPCDSVFKVPASRPLSHRPSSRSGY